ncbi:MAG TPA: hypothetical protein VE326_02360 [Candidatus Binatia bacterium]|nr:hypothetical protein [Candidatus Binatia bacterium]
MSEPKIVEEQVTAKEAPTAESALTSGRTRFDVAMKKDSDSARCLDLLEAAHQFQRAIQIAPDAPEAYGWLAQTYRMMAAASRAADSDRADLFTRFACAIAWEGTIRSTPTSVTIRTKQEVRTLVAWLRATRHLSPADAEAEMKVIHGLSLEQALSY